MYRDREHQGSRIVRGFEVWGHPVVYVAAALVLLAAAANVFGGGRCLNARVQIENRTDRALTVSYTEGVSGCRGRGGEYYVVERRLPAGARRSYLVAGTTEVVIRRGDRVIRRIRAELYQDEVEHVIGRREARRKAVRVERGPIYVRHPRGRVVELHHQPVVRRRTVVHHGPVCRPRRYRHRGHSGVGVNIGWHSGGGLRIGGSVVLR